MADTPEAQAPSLEQKSTSPKDLKTDAKADLNGHKSPPKANESEPAPSVNGNGTKAADHEGPNGVTPTPEGRTEDITEDKPTNPDDAQASTPAAAATKSPEEAPVEAKDGDVEMTDTPAEAAPALPAATVASEEVANKSLAESQSPVTDSNEAKTSDVKPSDAAPPELPTTTPAPAPAPADTGDAMAIDEKQEPRSPVKESVISPPNADTQLSPSKVNDGAPAGMSKLAIDEPKKPLSPSADQDDVAMEDAPPSAKIAREREDEDDAADEPLAKRAKTEQSEEEVQVATQAAEAKSRRGLDGVENWNNQDIDQRPITPYRVKEYRRLLAGAKKTKAGYNFRDAVINLWPQLKEPYEARVERPMHLGELERGLRDNKYGTIGDFKKDLALLYLNSLAFNGETHDVTTSGLQVVETVYTRCLAVPEEEPPRPKHAKQIPSRHHEQRSSQQQPKPKPAPGPGPGPSADVSKPTVAPVNRPTPKPKAKPSQPSRRTSTATSPVDDARGAQTFAVPPGGVPQIRRASTHADGDRPKRAIHPPKSKDLDYTEKPLSRKQLKPELQFCDVVLREIMDEKHYMMNAAFLEPVDPVSLGIPDYFKIIKKPMDLGTIAKTLSRGGYSNVKQFQADMELMFNNCFKFNMPGQPVYVVGEKLQSLYHSEMAKKAQWLAKHAASKPASVESPAHTDDEYEAEAEMEVAAVSADYSVMASTIATLQEKLQEETAKLNSLYMEDVPNEIVIKLQHTVVSTVQDSLLAEKKKLAAMRQDKPVKAKASKQARPKPAAGGGSRKSGGGGGAKKAGGGGAKKAPKKERVWTGEDRNDIANALSDPDFANIDQAITIIKRDTGQAENNGVLELDIDQLSTTAIQKLWELCSKSVPGFGRRTNNAGGGSAADVSSPAHDHHASGAGRAGSGGTNRKKNKPMKAREQEERISQLMAIKEQFHATGKAASPKAADDSHAAVSPAGDHEDDSSDTSDSEEE